MAIEFSPGLVASLAPYGVDPADVARFLSWRGPDGWKHVRDVLAFSPDVWMQTVLPEQQEREARRLACVASLVLSAHSLEFGAPAVAAAPVRPFFSKDLLVALTREGVHPLEFGTFERHATDAERRDVASTLGHSSPLDWQPATESLSRSFDVEVLPIAARAVRRIADRHAETPPPPPLPHAMIGGVAHDVSRPDWPPVDTGADAPAPAIRSRENDLLTECAPDGAPPWFPPEIVAHIDTTRALHGKVEAWTIHDDFVRLYGALSPKYDRKSYFGDRPETDGLRNARELYDAVSAETARLEATTATRAEVAALDPTESSVDDTNTQPWLAMDPALRRVAAVAFRLSYALNLLSIAIDTFASSLHVDTRP